MSYYILKENTTFVFVKFRFKVFSNKIKNYKVYFEISGEEWVLESKGCCPRYVPSCTGECPSPDCQEFYEPFEKPMLEGQCCPEYDCGKWLSFVSNANWKVIRYKDLTSENQIYYLSFNFIYIVPPQNACIFEPQYVVENGYERPLKDEEKTEKKLFQVNYLLVYNN